MFSYNNRAGVLILVACMASGVLWTRGLGLKIPRPVAALPLSRAWLLGALIVVAFGCCGMYLKAVHNGGHNESDYQIERVWLLSQGKVPYADFEFAYGPLLLYGPMFLNRLFSLDVAEAYYAFWAGSWLLGTFFLFHVIDRSNYPTSAKPSIFLTLFFAGAIGIMSMGTNYSLFRFAFPLFLIAKFQNLTRPLSSAVISAALAAGSTLILLLISPETAIAFSFAAVFLFSIFLLRSRNAGADRARWTSICLLLGALTVEFWIAHKLHMLDTLISDGSGADSFPIFIAPVILLYIGTAFVCSCVLYRRIAEGELTDSNIGFISFSIPMIPAVLGRCDPAHIFWNGLGMFLASMFYISNYAIAWKRYRLWFLLLLVVIPWVTLMPLSWVARKSPATARELQRSEATDPLLLDKLYPSWHGGFFAPFGFVPSGRWTVLSPRIDYGHFDAFVNHNSVESIQETIHEIDGDPQRALILSSGFENHCETNPLGQQVVMSMLFGFPYFGRAVHTQSVRKPLCDYILAHYVISQPPNALNYNYGLWTRGGVPQARKTLFP